MKITLELNVEAPYQLWIAESLIRIAGRHLSPGASDNQSATGVTQYIDALETILEQADEDLADYKGIEGAGLGYLAEDLVKTMRSLLETIEERAASE